MDVFNGYQLFGPEMVIRMRADGGVPKTALIDGVAHPCVAVAGDGGGNLFLLVLPSGRVLKWLHETGRTIQVSTRIGLRQQGILQPCRNRLSFRPCRPNALAAARAYRRCPSVDVPG